MTEPILAAGEKSVPVGRLGVPLGTYLRIEGSRGTDSKIGNELMVDTINGEKLLRPVAISIANINPLPRNLRCVLKGYETIKTTGSPPAYYEWERENGKGGYGLQGHYGWRVQWSFIVLTAVSPKPLKVTPMLDY